MKKAMKKLMAALLAVAMVCAMAIPAFAAKGEPVTNSGVSLTNHDFEAYQIFSAKLDSAGRLSDVEWGEGVKGNELLVALQADTTLGDFADCYSASDLAEKLAAFNTEKATKFAAFVANGYLSTTKIAGTGTITLPSAGYYLIKDVTEVEGEYDASNLTLLLVSGAEEVTPKVKTDIPTLQKKVKDKNDSIGESATTGWQDSADYDIGDIIPYQLTATLGNVSNFDTYYVEFVDTMDHLTYNGITSVKVGDKTLSAGDYTSNWDSANKKLTVSIDDVKKHGATNGSTITVEYTAILDSDAVIGSTGNPNEAYLVFSNNPNGDGKGKTAPDKNIVFTYKVVANKVDEHDQPLTGAAFALYKKLPAVPNPEDGTSYFMEGTDAYTLVKELNVGADRKEVADKTQTIFEWKGIDDGEYMIKEIITPAGYNSIEPIKFKVEADHETEAADPKLTELTGGDKFAGAVSTGTLTANIQNRMGSTLPGTGGIGTTIFYVIGGGLMVAAAILLITKKRMENR
jgi:fimbrial isopeptide formation D2 family protein/LPXTG-motif cell wall-anchored protein